VPITFTEKTKVPAMRTFRQIGVLTFSGSYVVGGEVPTGIIKVWTSKPAFGAQFWNKGPHTFRYDPVTGKVLVYLGGVEASAAAYPAAVTSDVVTMDIEYPKLG
jgi:hypothetical protein